MCEKRIPPPSKRMSAGGRKKAARYQAFPGSFQKPGSRKAAKAYIHVETTTATEQTIQKRAA
jgi:hypothetical protein